jgi:cytochrome P450
MPGEDLAAALLDESLFSKGDPHALYKRLREEAPVARHDDPPFWVLSKHADVVAVSSDPATFCSRRGILLMEIGVEYASPPTMMHTDPPDHTRYRGLVQPAFKPSLTKALEPLVRSRVQELLDAIDPGAPTDFVEAVSVPFPLQVICELLGLPSDDWRRLWEWSEAVIPGATDWPEDRRNQLQAEMFTELVTTANQRRADPRDDIISAIAAHGLSDDELAMFLVQLLVAGNETSRNMLSGGVAALAQHADQWRRLKDDPGLVPTAVEEMLRWTTPVIYFMRTATRDVEIRGQRIAEGDAVVLLYASANRDDEQFGTTVDRLDVGRHPNHHVAFGFGPHFCLGAALARLEGRVLLEELTRRFAGLEPAGPVERSSSSVIAGVTRAPICFAA